MCARFVLPTLLDICPFCFPILLTDFVVRKATEKNWSKSSAEQMIQVEPDNQTRSMKSKPVMVAISGGFLFYFILFLFFYIDLINRKYEIRFVCVGLFAYIYDSPFPSVIISAPQYIRMCVTG